MITPNFSSGPQGLTQFSGNCEVSLCKQQKVLCMAKNIQTHTKQNQNQQVEVKQMTDFASCATPSSTSLSLLLTCAPPWASPFCVCVVSGVPESDQKHTGWQQLHNQILSPAKCAGAKPNLSTCAAFQHSAFVAGFPTFILFYVFFTVSRYAANKPPFPLHTNPPNPAPIYPDSTSIDFI